VYSYGRRMAKPQYAYYHIFAATTTSPGNGLGTVMQTNLMRVSNSTVPVNGSAIGSAVGYDQVTELDGLNGVNGETVYKYINEPDSLFSFYDPTETIYYIRPPYGSNVSHLLNGTLYEQTEYQNVGGQFIKVKDILNTYDNNVNPLIQRPLSDSGEHPYQGQPFYFSSTSPGSANTVWAMEFRPWDVNRVESQVSSPCEGDWVIYPSLTSQWEAITSSVQKIYSQNDTTKYVTTTTNYYYDDTAHLLPTRVVVNDSKGELITAYSHYPLDYPHTTGSDAFSLGIKYLQNNHFVSSPVEKYVQRSNTDGSNTRTISANLYSYNANQPFPSLIYNAEFSSGPDASFVPATDNSGLIMDPTYQPLILFDQYDQNGNLLQQNKASDVNHSYIWDYFSCYPIAEVVNAVQSDIAYTSFEFDGSGNWTVPDTTRVRSGKAITGSLAYNLTGSNAISKSGLNNATKYVVGFWGYTGGSVTVNGASATAKIVLGNWTYYEAQDSGVTSITIGGTGIIDEVRLFPKGALMDTYTYAPLIGITSHCDASGKLTYYSYDGLGRLHMIQDQYGNILKRYDYEYQTTNN
jgi:YD repeat-containing protein